MNIVYSALELIDYCITTFMLDVISGRKKALSKSELTLFKILGFAELSLKNIMEELEGDEEMQQNKSEITAEGKKQNKTTVMTVLSSMRPSYIKNIVENAFSERAKEERPMNTEPFTVIDEFMMHL